ncbi:MAG: hypothetical protein ACRD1V_08740 [Vicinamibacterales bacterium]
MRALLLVIGIVLVALGIFAAVGQASFHTNKDVLKVGGMDVSVKEPHAVPPWTGAIGIVVGGALIIAGARRS